MTDTTPSQLEATLSRASSAATDCAARTIDERAGMLRTLADRIDADAGVLIPMAEGETHLRTERLIGEVGRTTGQLRFLAEVILEGHWLEARIDTADPAAPDLRPDVRSMNIPIGVALVFAASNFPFAFSVAGCDTAAALAAGCPVILKSHPGHPELSARVGALVREVFGTGFAVISGLDVGRVAIVDRRVKVAAFTGSTLGGRSLFNLAVGREDPIPFYGELGSINPAFVSPAAAMTRGPEIAPGFVSSFTLGTGQFCTKPGLLFVPKGSDLLSEVVAAARATEPAPMLGSWVYDGHVARRQALWATPGVEVALDPGTDDATRTKATVLTTTTEDLLQNPRYLIEECFGPTAVVVEYDDIADLITVCDAIGGSLTASIHAEPDEAAILQPLADALRLLAGRVVWNGWTTGVRVSWAMQHGGPWPASTSVASTSVGAASIRRFLRPIAYQNAPDICLPPVLRNRNRLGIPRRIDGVVTTTDVDKGTA